MDFGLAYSFEYSSNSQTHSVPRKHHWQYAAPELEWGTKSDVFALGGVLYDIAAVITGNKTMLDYRATESVTRFGNAEESSTARNGLLEQSKKQKTRAHESGFLLSTRCFILIQQNVHLQ